MDMAIQILMMVVGIGILTFGAEILVRGASTLAIAMKISPLVVGLTVVAYGTGAPELVVSLQAVLVENKTGITVGNIIGSNVFNLLIPVGLSAIVIPLYVSKQVVRFEVPVLVVASLMFYFFSFDGNIGRTEGIVFCVLLLSYTIWTVVKSRKDEKASRKKLEEETGVSAQQGLTAGVVIWNVFLLGLGLAGLVFGANLFLQYAVELAKSWGITDLVIGLTLVAVGTSLPEVATSVVAALRGQKDMAVGNAIGSSLFNILGVLGISGIVAQSGLVVEAQAIHFDLPVLVAVTVLCLPVFFSGYRVTRIEGTVFVLYYIAYMTYLVVKATNSAYAASFNNAMLYGVIPLTVLVLIEGLIRSLVTKPPAETT